MGSEKEGIRYRERDKSRLKTTSSPSGISISSQEVARFIPAFLNLPKIRRDKVKRIRALVEKGQYDTEKRLRVTAERIAKLLTRVS